MRYVKTLGLMLLAVLALSAVAASAASAFEGSVLGSTAGEVAKTASAGATFEATGSAIIVKCTSSEGTSTTINSTSSKFDELFLGCTAAGAKCTGLADTTTGSILVTGTTELLHFLTAANVLDLAVIFTINPVHFECLGILTEVKGSVIGLITDAAGVPTGVLHASLVGSKGAQSVTSVNGVEHKLLSETNGGAFVAGSQTQADTVTAPGTTKVEPMY
jgi:hypothetical protein